MKLSEYMGVRYPPPEEDVCAYLCFDPAATEFHSDVEASIENESYGGCKLRLSDTSRLQLGDHCIAQVGVLRPLDARVVWRHADDDGMLEVGLEFEA